MAFVFKCFGFLFFVFVGFYWFLFLGGGRVVVGRWLVGST